MNASLPPRPFVLLVVAAALLAWPRPAAAQVERQRAQKSLPERLAAVLGRAEKLDVTCGAYVQDIAAKDAIYAYQERRPFVPASNMKLLTAAHALECFGEKHAFETVFETAGDPAVLYVRSGGDPGLTDEMPNGLALFDRLAAALKQKGLTSFPGGLVLDAPGWIGPARPPAWDARHHGYGYGAPTGPFALFEGCVVLRLVPGEREEGPCPIEFVPSCLELPLAGAIQLTGDRKLGGQYRVAWTRDGGVELGGHYYRHAGEATVRVPCEDPERLFEAAMRCVLTGHGIEIGPRRDALPLGPRERLYVHETPLLTVLERMLQESSNFQAEMLLRLCGRKLGGEASFEKGTNSMLQRFAVLGLEADELQVHDGSGLSDENRISPAVLAGVLQHAVVAPYNRGYVLSMAQSGVSGTVRSRMRDELRGAVRAKTGTIAGACTLSGYVRTKAGKTYLFVILMNWSNGRSLAPQLRSIQDAFVTEIFENV